LAALEKVYTCLSCGQEIKLERKPDTSGWCKWNLNGTKHVDEKKNKKQTVDNGPQLAALAEQMKYLKESVNILISQIQGLRSEVKKRRRISEQNFSIS
jgi:hypothetical protein